MHSSQLATEVDGPKQSWYELRAGGFMVQAAVSIKYVFDLQVCIHNLCIA